ncbi:MAG: TonB-dependent receptor, partial [Vicinamibacterales bacterium]
NPDTPTFVTPFEATRQRVVSIPTMTPAHLTHVLSANTVWEARVGRFVYDEDRTPSTGDWARASHQDRVTNVTTGAPPQIGSLTLIRTTGKATIGHYRSGLLGADHHWRMGAQVERGEQDGANIVPTGVRFVDDGRLPVQSISSAPSNVGGMFVTGGWFVSDAITAGNHFTVNAGLRFDHSRAISQDLPVVDPSGHETDTIVQGLGTVFTWNEWSPRLGVTAKLTSDGQTMLRGSYGRFTQGVFTGELTPFHPGSTTTTTRAFEAATGDYTRLLKTSDARINLRLDPDIQAPRTHEYSLALDREVRRGVGVSITYVHKRGSQFIGWTDIGGQYVRAVRTLADGRSLPVLVLSNSLNDQRFLLTNPDGYSLLYNGMVVGLQKRHSHGWHASGSYTFSKASGLQASSGELASGAQASTIATPTRLFGRDPNDLTNARGRLPNDRPHVIRMTGSIDVRHLGVVVTASLQLFSGKPWAATTQMDLQQLDQRILLEPRGSRRLSSQSLLDLRLSKTFTVAAARIDLLLDILNALNDTAEEALATDNLFSPNFGQPTLFMDPRRAMLGIRLNLNHRR